MKQVLSEDGLDLLLDLQEAGVRFLVVGGHALAVHGLSRATVDLDIFVEPSAENAAQLLKALRAFGAPLKTHGVTQADFEHEGTVYQMGLPPNRIDLITMIDGVTFEQAWTGRVEAAVDNTVVPFIGFEDLLQNKRAAGRPKDLADVDALLRLRRRERRS